jgi:hypothetical protein
MGTSVKEITKTVVFELTERPGCDVFVAGTFNGWDPGKTRLKPTGDGLYRASVRVPKGKHEYKFVIDGTWITDPACSQCVSNDLGTLNSVLMVDDTTAQMSSTRRSSSGMK